MTSIPQSSVIAVDERLPAQVVVQVDLIPGLFEASQAFGHGLHPDGLGILFQEDLRRVGVIVQEQQAAWWLWVRDEHLAATRRDAVSATRLNDHPPPANREPAATGATPSDVGLRRFGSSI